MTIDRIYLVEVQRNAPAGTISRSQEKHVNAILERYGMSDCEAVSRPGTAR